MQRTVWKPEEELRQSLGTATRVAVFSCGFCANLSGTGGPQGIRVIKARLDRWGIKLARSRVVIACCAEEIVRQNLKICPVQGFDALVMLSCAGGVKSAMLCNPGIPVIPACDTLGSMAITARQDHPAAFSRCVACGHCVIGFTAGICPVSACPAKRKNGPCAQAPPSPGPCPVNPAQQCVWREIERHGGDLDAIQNLHAMHNGGSPPHDLPAQPASPVLLRRLAGMVMSRVKILGHFAPWIS